MDDHVNALTLDNLGNNPDFDFLRHLLIDNSDENEEDISPYSNMEISCKYYDENQLINVLNAKKEQTFMSLNNQSLPAKFSELEELIKLLYLNNCEPDIICLQETWRIFDSSLYTLDNYSLEILSRSNNVQGGGVGMYIKNGLRYKILKDVSLFTDKVYESLFVQITESKHKFIVGSAYRPNSKHPTLTVNEQTNMFLEQFSGQLAHLSSFSCPIYVLGDFNIDLLKVNDNASVKNYVDTFFAAGFIQTIMKPTRCTSNTATLIDHILTKCTNKNLESYIRASKISDHFPIFLTTEKMKPLVPNKYLYVRDFSSKNISNFKQDLHCIKWADVYSSVTVHESYDVFSSVFTDLYDLRFPSRKIKFNKRFHKIEKWMTSGLLTSRATKKKLSLNSIKFPTHENISNYKNYRKLFNKLIRASKKSYYEEQLKLNQSNMKKTWELINQATKRGLKNKNLITCLIVDGKNICNPEIIANTFNSYFASIASEIESKIPPADPAVNPIPSIEPNVLFDLSNPIISQDIIDVIKQLKPKHSLDPKNLSMIVLKSVANEICMPLKHIVNLSLSTGEIPAPLKIAKIVPIFKSGDLADMNNYRPISLISTFGKVLEKIVANKLFAFLEENEILCKNQFGFRTAHSTVHPMMLLLNKLTSALNEKKHSLIIFCDLKKAFDTCDHEILLKKMYNIGIRNNELLWFKNYLKDRRQYVVINDIPSSLCNVLKGVPQGSILGPILFLIYINDLPKCSMLFSLLFADDTTLVDSDLDLNTLIARVNAEFQKVTHYFRVNKLSLHPDKTKFLLITSNKSVQNMNIDLFINNNSPGSSAENPNLVHKMDRVDVNSAIPAMRFLGAFFDPNLNFKYHVELIISKVSRALYILRTVKNILTEKALKSLYYSLIHCHLIYAIPIWSICNQQLQKELYIKQKMAIRIVCGLKYNDHTEPMFKKLEILPLPQLIDFFSLQFMQRFVQGFLPVAFNETWTTNAIRREGQSHISLRNDNDMYAPPARLSITSNHPLTSFPKKWESLTDESVRILRDKKEFDTALKNFFLQKLASHIKCTNPYCPSCAPKLT